MTPQQMIDTLMSYTAHLADYPQQRTICVDAADLLSRMLDESAACNRVEYERHKAWCRLVIVMYQQLVQGSAQALFLVGGSTYE